ncbi:MAG: serine hydrolase, partial [Oscillospiraceae bacterium]
LLPHVRTYEFASNKEDAIDVILKSEFAYKKGTEVSYSCLGYILLGKLLEIATGESLDVLAKKMVFDPLEMNNTIYCPTSKNCATTEYSQTLGRYLCGEVHDENARFLDGIAGNAGVFSTIDDMIKFATMLSNKGLYQGKPYLSSRTFETATKNFTRQFSTSRGLGFLLKDSRIFPAGELFSDDSYGHTGFTGTSVFVDEKTGLYGILLSNSVHFGRATEDIFRTRRLFYNSVIAEFVNR